MKPLVSIIIPVYQVEKYLDKCIVSVINQTYNNLEIILVDDGSPDNCPAICDQWQTKDPRIKVIHQENGGLSHARNEGLKIATGEFIGFVDSDDWIEPKMYETLLTALLESDADIAICNYQSEHEDSQVIIQKTKLPVINTYTAEAALELLLSEKAFIHNFVWNKLFRKHLLENLPFPEGKLYEDIAWTPKIIGEAKKIITIDLPFYHYLRRSDSLSHDLHNLYGRLNDAAEMIENRIEYIHEYYPVFEDLVISKYQSWYCQKYIQISLKNSQIDIDIDGSTRRMLHINFCKYNWNKNLQQGNFKEGFKCLIFRFCPRSLPLFSSIGNKLKNIWHKAKSVNKSLLNQTIGLWIMSFGY